MLNIQGYVWLMARGSPSSSFASVATYLVLGSPIGKVWLKTETWPDSMRRHESFALKVLIIMGADS
jgi:hypothetical protein